MAPKQYIFRCVSDSDSGEWVSEWVMFSDFGDSYRIYRACKLVLNDIGEFYQAFGILLEVPHNSIKQIVLKSTFIRPITNHNAYIIT